MNLEDISPLPGAMCDYDFAMMPKAQAVLDHLRTRPDFQWWNRWIRRPEGLTKAGGDNFLGWDSFVCRNGNHELSRAIFHEFRRVYGEPVTLRSSLE